MKKLVAVVPARSFDEVLKNKNILSFGNSNLLVNKVKQLKKVDLIDEVLVSSDSKKYLDLVKSEDIIIDHRPIEFAALDSNFGDFVEYICSKVNANHILWASPTSPLVNSDDFSSAINKYFEIINNGYDSLISVNKIKRHMLDDNGPLNFRFKNSLRNNEKLPTLYEFTNGIVIAPRLSMIKWRYNWGFHPFKLEMNHIKIVDICNEWEYKFANFLKKSKESFE